VLIFIGTVLIVVVMFLLWNVSTKRWYTWYIFIYSHKIM